MKKIIIIALLMFFGLAEGQQYKNITMYRGSYKQFTFLKKGDLSTYSIYFTVKPNRTLTSVRYIDLANSVAGGSDSEIFTTFDGTYTTIIVTIADTSTANLTETQLDYDLVAEIGGKETPLFTGVLSLIFDVRSPFDGITNASDLNYFIAILAKNLTAGYYVKVDTTASGSYIFTSAPSVPDVSNWGNIIDTVKIETMMYVREITINGQKVKVITKD